MSKSPSGRVPDEKCSEDTAECPVTNVHLADGGSHPTIRSWEKFMKSMKSNEHTNENKNENEMFSFPDGWMVFKRILKQLICYNREKGEN